jgi:hypothetical protein
VTETRDPRLWEPIALPTIRRVPTNREDTEVRVFPVEGRAVGEPDIVVQVYQRVGHDLDAPWGPTAAAVRVPRRFATRLAELIIETAAEGAA